MLDIEPTAAVAPSADLVLRSRLGLGYEPEELQVLLDNRVLIELRSVIRPSEDIALYRADMAEWKRGDRLTGWRKSRNEWVLANDACRRDILRRLAVDGPTATGDLPDTCVVPWKSTGWTNNRNVSQLLELTVARGEVAVAGRRRGQRLWARSFAATPQAYQFGVCATSSSDPHCTFDPNAVPKVMDTITPTGVNQSTELDYTLGPVVLQGVTMP